MSVDPNVVGLLVAALGGAAVGLERQWSGHADGAAARFAGIRTFTLLGAIGGLGGLFSTLGLTTLATVLLLGAVGISVSAYVAGAKHDIDGTTEVAALVVVAAGVLAGIGSLKLASGIIALETLLLAEKSRLHAVVRRIDDVGLRAGIRFGVLALVVLPVLPEGPYGPFGGIRPRALWALTLFFSGLSFLGYVARRVIGPGHGYLVTGFLAGLVSSTNATFAFARLSRKESNADRSLAFGAVAANAVLYPRVLVATAALNPGLVPLLAMYLFPPALVAWGVAAFGTRRSGHDARELAPSSNPLELGAALRVSLIFQVVLMVAHSSRGLWGDAGTIGSAAALGLTDVDALTAAMSRAAGVPAALAAAAIATGVLSNTAMKLGLTAIFGSTRFRIITGLTLLVMLVAGAAALALFHGALS